MTTAELIELIFLSPGFLPPLGDQLGDEVAAFRRLAEAPAQALERGEARFHQQAVVFDAEAEDVALADSKLFAQLCGNHDATLSTDFDLCHQEITVPNLRRNGKFLKTWHYLDAGPKAAMMRFWYSESSSGEMK